MKVNNPLSREFLLAYPAEAARVLEQVSTEHVAAFFTESPPSTTAPVLAAMLPQLAAASVKMMESLPAARLLTELSLSSTARIYRYLTDEKKSELSSVLPDKIRNKLHQQLEYPLASVGSLLDPEVDRLPDNVTVADAIRRIERREQPVACEIYITNDAHQLVGMVSLGKLLASNHHAKLRDMMSRKTQAVSVHATIDSLILHPAWKTRHRLPVVERDNSLLGVLNYSSLQEAIDETGSLTKRDPFEGALSLANLYWLSLTQLLNSMLNIARQGKEEKQ